MPVIVGGKIIEGGPPQSISGAGAPADGTDEIQTITFGGSPEASSTFRLTYDGWKTAPITWSATNNTLVANVDAALEALPNIGTGGVTTAVGTMTSGVGTLTATFVAQNGKTNVPLIAGSEFLQSTGAASANGTVIVTTSTAGVTATGRGSAPGTRYNDYTNGVDYTNTGTAIAPTWTAVSVGNISAELITLGGAIPTSAVAAVAGLGIAISAADPTAVAAADAVAVAGTTPAGGTGATAGAYDSAVNRDAFIATVAEMKTTVNALVTEATELKAKAGVERTELIELKLDIGTLSTTVVEIKARLNELLVALRTAAIVTP